MVYCISLSSNEEEKIYYVEAENSSEAINKLCIRIGIIFQDLPKSLHLMTLDSKGEEESYGIHKSTEDFVPVRCAVVNNYSETRIILFNGSSIEELNEIIQYNPVSISDFTDLAMLIE